MDPETVTAMVLTAKGAAGAIKGVIDAIGAARAQVKDNKEADKKLSDFLDLVIELRTRILALQEKAFDFQKDLGELQSENMKLREEIRSKEERAADRQKYQRKQVGRAVLMVHSDDPSAYFCPACFETKERPIPLQNRSNPMSHSGTYLCPSCDARYVT